MAVFSIDQLKANLDIVRPNLFEAEVILPYNVRFTRRNDISKFTFRCESTELPGRTVATYDDQSVGTTRKHAYDITYNDINLTIIASKDMGERKIFEEWIDNIVNPSGHNAGNARGGLLKYYSDYAKGLLTVKQLDDKGNNIVAYTMHDAYPIQISPMNLTWAEVDTYQRFTVTMTYRYYTRLFGGYAYALPVYFDGFR